MQSKNLNIYLRTRNRNSNIQVYLQRLDATAATDYFLWKAIKKLKQPIAANPSLRKSEQSWACCDMEKAKTFAKHLTEVFTLYTRNQWNMRAKC